MPVIHAYFPKTAGTQEGTAAFVLWEDTGHQLPESCLFGCTYERLHGQSSSSSSTGLASDIHRELCNADVAFPFGSIVGTGCEGNHLTLIFDHDDGMNAIEPALHIRD